MSLISKTINRNAVTEFEYPDIEGFFVKVAYVDRETLTKIRNASLEYKFNKGTRQREEVSNTDKFLELYAEKAIKGWRGLKFKHLPTLYPADIAGEKPDKEIPYTPEDALELLQVSVDFDRFITDTQENLDSFSRTDKEEEVKNSETSSAKS
jgi:hypothetical protein